VSTSAAQVPAWTPVQHAKGAPAPVHDAFECAAAVQVQFAFHTELCGPSPSEITPGALSVMLQTPVVLPLTMWLNRLPPTLQAPSLVLATVIGSGFVCGNDGPVSTAVLGITFTDSVPGVGDSARPVHEEVRPGGRNAPPNNTTVETPVTIV